ncbi:MAG: MFS transporter [Anaerolineales bacterium]|nr:MFS transporter [Anaerolineales bacterium]
MIANFLDAYGINREIAALSIARLADAMGNSILVVIIPLYVVKLSTPSIPESLLVGLLISVYGFVFTILQPFTGAMSDRLDRRKAFILGGLIVMAVSTFSFNFATSFTHLIIIRTLQGLGVALTVPASLAVLAEGTSRQSRGGSMGFYTTLRMVGFAIGPLLGGYLQVRHGFQSAFLAGTALLIVGAVLVQFWVHDRPARTEKVIRYRILDRRLLGDGIVYLGIAMFLMASAFSMMAALENEFNLRLQQTALGFGIAFSALTVSRLIFQLPFGRVSDLIGRRPIIIAGLIALAPATALLGYVTSTLQLTGARAFQGLATAAIAAPAFALAGDISIRGGEGQQMSILAMGFGLGIAAGPIIAGSLAVIRFELPFLVGALLCLVGAWIVYGHVPEPNNSSDEG